MENKRKKRKPVITEFKRKTNEIIYHIFDERSISFMTLNQFLLRGLCENKECEYNKSWKECEKVIDGKIRPVIDKHTKNDPKKELIDFLIDGISKHLLFYLCYSCEENNTGKRPLEIKKECSRIVKNLEAVTVSLKKLNSDPTFREAIHVLLTDCDDIPSESYDKIEFNHRINEIEDTISILKKISSLKTGMEATRLKDMEREKIFAWLMIVFKVINGKEPENEIRFRTSNIWNEGTDFYKLMNELFEKFKISIPAEMTTREYLIRFPFNDNDRGGFIQSCYEALFGEHPNKKKYLNK